MHHKYNKEHTLSPFAGLAFHPLDGIMQALPYALALFIVPMHFMTHELLLFATALWTANIHDNIHANLLPIMGAGWHTIHHTSYRHNYGHYTVIMDWLFGTLISPEEFEAEQAARKSVVAAPPTAPQLKAARLQSEGVGREAGALPAPVAEVAAAQARAEAQRGEGDAGSVRRSSRLRATSKAS